MARQRNNLAQYLLPADARDMLRLWDALHRSAPEPILRKRLLLEGLCRLVGADAARSVVTWFDPATADRTVLSAVEFNSAGTSPAPPAATGALPPAETAPAAGEHTLDAFVDLDGMGLVATLTVSRRRPLPRFTPRERAIVEVMHTETAWIYGHDRMQVAPEVLALPPRERQALQLLLSGRGESWIAEQLSISPNTVHHYVKSIYRRFGVRSRSELIEHWDRSAHQN